MSRGKSKTSGMPATGSIGLGGRRTAWLRRVRALIVVWVRFSWQPEQAGRFARHHGQKTVHPFD